MDVQVVSVEALIIANQDARNDAEREHPTLYLRRNSERFRTIHVVANSKLCNPNLGLTLDEKSDFDFICSILDKLSSPVEASCLDILQTIRKEHLAILNDHVPRRVVD
jgi:spore coat polysaccharide biosynthesis protein SpsF (cytidylyltransferase family)